MSRPGSPMEGAAGAARRPAEGRRSWHRRASRPVLWWMVALLVVVGAHPFLPQSRWLMVHMVTLGLLTTSIMIWGQHFAEALLKTRLAGETRGAQLARIRVLTAGVVLACVGMLPSWPWLVLVGALLISGAMLWYATALGRQLRASLAPRFAFTVRAYMLAACLLPLGAVLGTLLAFGPGEPWQGRLLLAHQILNVLGFVGLTVAGTLLTLWPTVLRTRLPEPAVRRASWGLHGMAAGVLIAATAALVASAPLGCAALLLYAASLAWLGARLVAAARRSHAQEHRIEMAWFPILSIGAGVCWFIVAVLATAGLWWSAGPDGSLLAAQAQRLSVTFVVGFGLQVLLGAMSFLMPTVMGGGPRAVRAGLAEMSRGAALRVVALNLVLALFAVAQLPAPGGAALFAGLTLGGDAAAFGSFSRVLLSAVALVVLAWFLVLMGAMVRVNLRERRATAAEPPGPQPLGMPGRTGAGSGAAPASGSPAPAPLERRHLTGAVLAAGGVLGLNAVGAALDRASASASGTGAASPSAPGAEQGSVAPTGRTTRARVVARGMRFEPARIDVPVGDELVISVRNEDPEQVHDLVLDGGASSGRLDPHAEAEVRVGVVRESLEGWCSIVGHRAMGMTLSVVAVGADGREQDAAASGGGGAGAAGTDPLAPVVADLAAAPGADHARRSPALPADPGPEQRFTLEMTEHAREIAPGVRMDAMTFGGQVVGPVIRSRIGGRLTIDLVNRGSMGHSIDLHAGRVAPDRVMRTIAPGQSLEYAIITEYAGVWLYHCSTMPMTAHLAAGMLGALIVPPQGMARADREFVLVQSDHYLVPEGAEGASAAMHPGARPVSSAKIAAERPDFTVFNGHANQYVHEPLEARVGERVRIWVLAAGPSRGISFHVVGAVFDTVFKEGEFLLRPDAATGGGAQVLDLASAQGGFVEMVFEEPGTYTAVNHVFADMERGARALIRVTA